MVPAQRPVDKNAWGGPGMHVLCMPVWLLLDVPASCELSAASQRVSAATVCAGTENRLSSSPAAEQGCANHPSWTASSSCNDTEP